LNEKTRKWMDLEQYDYTIEPLKGLDDSQGK
jgi:hypothetical protein